jgi:asparagine synthase (glutamine-hydrolysing)
MCGIAGSIGSTPPSPGNVRLAQSLLRHRGPDANGIVVDTLGPVAYTLLHTRLSIIDLDHRSDQPMELDDCIIVFNGEIYNYKEIRKTIEAEGVVFHTNSDTEVLIRAYRKWGLDLFDELEGMWAFCLLDKRTGKFILCRDRFGEKPLYYSIHNNVLYFASEFPALTALSGQEIRPNLLHVKRFLVHGYKSLHKQREGFLEDVHEFPAASYAIVDGSGPLDIKRYWTLNYSPQRMSRGEAVEEARRRLIRATELRLRADVPLALCLSGGIDSTALAGIAIREFGKDITCFSIFDSDPRYDERENVEASVAEFGCKHHSIETRHDGFVDELNTLVCHQWSPVTTITAVIQSFLVRDMSANGFKVALMGIGADELFTGYYDHYNFWLAIMKDRPDLQSLLEEWKNSYGSFVNNRMLMDPNIIINRQSARDHIYLDRDNYDSFLTEPLKENFFEEEYCDDTLRNRMLNELFHETVPPTMREGDLHSMMYSLENRSPYLDKSLAEFMFTVPTELLIHEGYCKWVLREAAKDYLPTKVGSDRRKRGFNASIDSLLDRNDPHTMDRLLCDSPIFDIISRPAMEKLLRSDLNANSLSKFVFAFLSSKLFLQHCSDRSMTNARSGIA